MSVYSTVVVGTDGSVTAGRAVRRAATIANGLSIPLMVTTAYMRVQTEDMGPRSIQSQLPEDFNSFGYIGAQETAQDAATIARKAYPNLDVDVATPQGDPADALLDFTEDRGNALLIIGGQGLGATGIFSLGNVPNKIIHHAVGDTMVVRTGRDRADDQPHRMLMGTDGSRTATMALERAIEVARGMDASLTVVTVGRRDWATDVLAEAEARVKAAGVPVVTEQHDGNPAAVLVERAVEFDLLVLGNRGMTGARRFLLGSVPNKVSHHVGTDLLIVKTT